MSLAKVYDITSGEQRVYVSPPEDLAEGKASFLAELDRIRQGVELGTIGALVAVTIHAGADPSGITVHYERATDVTKLQVRGALWWLDNYFRGFEG